MTITELAREAGIHQPERFDAIDGSNQLERFAALHRAEIIAELTQGVEMPEAKAIVRGPVSAFNDPESGTLVDFDCEGPLAYSPEDGESLFTADQLRKTVAAAVARERKLHCACVFDGDKNTEQCKLHGAWCDTLNEQADYRRERDALQAELAKKDAEIAQRDKHMIEYNTRINAEVMKLLNEKDALRAEVARLRLVLTETQRTLDEANSKPGGPISDIIWYGMCYLYKAALSKIKR